ncbi:MAG: c-type cytochrome [Terriglobales bacterium]
MKLMKLTILVLAIAVALMMVVPSLSWAAEDGSAVYKTKCAACHGPDGAGKVGPAVKGTKVDVAEFVQNGAAGKKAPHTKGVNGVSADQAKAVGDYVKGLK